MREEFVVEISLGEKREKLLNDCARSKVHFVVLVMYCRDREKIVRRIISFGLGPVMERCAYDGLSRGIWALRFGQRAGG